jgi:glycosyltransferase involved in cell wall biosynthesis
MINKDPIEKLTYDHSSRMKNKPLVSIITVCRNSEKTISKTIESVLFQTYSRIEYIVVDGNSNDNTLGIIKAYKPKFKGRMIWISEKDLGIYDAMNKGIKLATGDIIGIINSDDWYELQSIEQVVTAYQNQKDAVYYGILRILENAKEVMLKLTNFNYLYQDVVGHPAYFVAKSIYDQYGVFKLEYKYASDYELMLRLVQYHVPFVQINSIFANFNQGGESAKHGLQTLEEQIKIRYKYGYISKKTMLVQTLKYRYLYFLKREKHDYLKVSNGNIR